VSAGWVPSTGREPNPPRDPSPGNSSGWIHRRAQDADDWDGYADGFAEDAVYTEHAFGTFEGREKIREWLVPIMEPYRESSFLAMWTSTITSRRERS
jgi:hypothetical protein